MKHLFYSVGIIIIIAGSFNISNAQEWTGNGDGTSWDDPANWSSGEPTLATLARINLNGGSDVEITMAGEVADRYIIGQGQAGNNSLTISSGSLTTDSGTPHRIGQVSEATLNVTGGTLTLQNGQQTLGSATNGDGTLNVSGGTLNFGGGVAVGSANGEGTINITGSAADFNVTGGTLAFNDNSDINFVADAAGVSIVDVTNQLSINPLNSVLTIDLTNFANSGSDLVLFDYGTLNATQNAFTSVNIINGTGVIDYAFDQGGGDLAVVLTNAVVIPEPATFALLVLIAGLGLLFHRKQRQVA